MNITITVREFDCFSWNQLIKIRSKRCILHRMLFLNHDSAAAASVSVTQHAAATVSGTRRAAAAVSSNLDAS